MHELINVRSAAHPTAVATVYQVIHNIDENGEYRCFLHGEIVEGHQFSISAEGSSFREALTAFRGAAIRKYEELQGG